MQSWMQALSHTAELKTSGEGDDPWSFLILLDELQVPGPSRGSVTKVEV